MRRFNITGTCFPDEHYMVDISERLDRISTMVRQGDYITINRGRQYGKTTTLFHLAQKLSVDYLVFSLSFESLTDEDFSSPDRFAFAFLEKLDFSLKYGKNPNPAVKALIENELKKGTEKKELRFGDLSEFISQLCVTAEKKVVLIIDEVDNASNFRSFIDFLRLLRDKYLARRNAPAFSSVILAGVYDIKNLKLKVRSDEEHQYNSPWNVALPFTDDMDFTDREVAGMLEEYEKDHDLHMDIDAIARLITDYTSGYPFLVSKICKSIDETPLSWDREGVAAAVKELLNERNTLFDDMNKKLDDNRELKLMFKDMLYYGNDYSYNSDNRLMELAHMFGYIKNVDGRVKISNRILETRLYNAFTSEEESTSRLFSEGSTEKNSFIENGTLNMKKILERFVVHYTDIYGDMNEEFHEKEGRKHFMLYIRPIINGTGNYYIEAETRDRSRTDMIIDYLGIQYIIEMKIWRGNAYNERGEKQLIDYLDYYHSDTGYMLSFNFNKKKETGVKTLHIGNKTIVEAVV